MVQLLTPAVNDGSGDDATSHVSAMAREGDDDRCLPIHLRPFGHWSWCKTCDSFLHGPTLMTRDRVIGVNILSEKIRDSFEPTALCVKIGPLDQLEPNLSLKSCLVEGIHVLGLSTASRISI